MSGRVGWTVVRLVRVGVTRTSLLDEDEAGIAGCDLGEGIACEEWCKEGNDIDP